MKQLLFASIACLSLVACSGKGSSQAAACAVNQQNRCSCGGATEGVQICLPSRLAYGACVCSDACLNGADCVAVPDLTGMDMDQVGDIVTDAGLALPDSADLDGGFTFVEVVADPPVQVIDGGQGIPSQVPAPGVPVKRGTQMQLTVTLPPNQESLGLPNSHFLVGALNQDTDISAQAYYDTIDPGPFPKRATLDDWKEANGFNSTDPNDAPDLQATGTYVSHADLGFGRRMHVRKKDKRVAFYVDNYLTGGDAVAGSNYFATVTMEWSPGPNGKDTDPYFTQFYVYNKKGDRIIDPKLDDHGPKNNPSVCLSCHGSNNTDFSYQTNGGNIGARFIPFDLDNLQFSDKPGADRASQEAAFKILNEAVYSTWDRNDPLYAGQTPPVIDMIDAFYGGLGHPSPTFIKDTVLPGWDTSQQAHDLYSKVFGKSCVGCHAQREPFRNFSTFAKFDSEKALVATRVFEQGVMPLSEKGSRNFWTSYPSQPKILAAFLGIPFKSPGTPVAHITVTHPGSFLTAGTVVTLSGQGSQYGSVYRWTQTSGPTVLLVPAVSDSSVMTFSAPASGTVTFQLVVSLSGQDSTPDVATVGVQGAPAAPGNVVATAGLNSASLTWTLPSDGGDVVKHSTVTAQPGNIVTQVPGAGTTTVVNGLTPGTSYTFTVVATNDIGDSTASLASNSVTVFTTPGAPIGVTAVRGDKQVTLSWSPPSNTGGAPLRAYQITGNPSPTTPVRILPDGLGNLATTAVISGLNNGTTYTFSVVADNGGLSSAAISNSATPDVAPLAPQSVTATPGNGSATINWSAPVSNGGTAVTAYVITASPTAPSLPLTVPGTSLSATVPSLTNNTTYTFTVQAQNGAGVGSAASAQPVFPSSNPGAPSSPQNVTAVFANSSLLATVTWAAPSIAGNSAITGYQITATPALAAPVNVGAAATSSNVSVPTGGLTYTFHVIAQNGQGAGVSGDSNPQAIEGPPQAPTLNSLNAAGASVGTLTPSWTAPGNTGGTPITGYTVTASPGASATTAGTSTTLTSANGLARCTNYTVSVKATNKWGTSTASSNSLSRINAVTPAQLVAPSPSTAPATYHLAWTKAAETGCPVTYKLTSAASDGSANIGFSDTEANLCSGVSCAADVGAPSCGYINNGATSSAHCGRSWSFTNTPSNAVGTAAASGSSASLRPAVSWTNDGLNAIVSQQNPHVSCVSCHKAGSSAAGLPFTGGVTANFNILINEVVKGNPNSSQFYLCPQGVNSCGCTTMHTPTPWMATNTVEMGVINQWITDQAPQ